MINYSIPKDKKLVKVNDFTWLVVNKNRSAKKVIETYNRLHGTVNVRGVLIVKSIFNNHDNS